MHLFKRQEYIMALLDAGLLQLVLSVSLDFLTKWILSMIMSSFWTFSYLLRLYDSITKSTKYISYFLKASLALPFWYSMIIVSIQTSINITLLLDIRGSLMLSSPLVCSLFPPFLYNYIFSLFTMSERCH